jgi:hypothetical protein
MLYESSRRRWGDMGEPSEEFVYDPENDLYRFAADGELSFSL